MPWNLPSYNKQRFSFGPGVLYLGRYAPTAAGATPTIDVGGVRPGSSLVAERTPLEVLQGSPATLVQSYVTAETATFEITGIEWKPEIWQFAVGAGVLQTTNAKEIFSFGGDMTIQEVALRFVHRTPAGGTVNLFIWRAQGTGALNLTFAEGIHEFPYSFRGLSSEVDWCNNPLPENQRLFRIVYEKP
jgi:hypothetical protein